MVEKEKLIKWLEVEWLEPYHKGISHVKKQIELNEPSGFFDFLSHNDEIKKLTASRDTISEMLLCIKDGTFDAFNHKGCQKI